MFEKTAENLSKRGFKVYCVKDANDALKKCLDIIKLDDVPAFAGSETIKQIGLVEALLERGNEICHRSYLKDGETAQDIMKKSLSADFIVCSANAVTKDGEMLNVDGTGNRIAATFYGPQNILFVVGKNKIVRNMAEAFERIKTTAARLNCIRFGKNTPCVNGGDCADCTNEETICNISAVYHHPPRGKNFYVVLVDDSLGY